jgi:hypothetical protein
MNCGGAWPVFEKDMSGNDVASGESNQSSARDCQLSGETEERAVTGKQATECNSACRMHSNHVVDVAIKTIADGGFIQRRLRNG